MLKLKFQMNAKTKKSNVKKSNQFKIIFWGFCHLNFDLILSFGF